MFRHTGYLQFDAAPEKPDPVYAHKLQELSGGAYGEMTVTMQYLFKGWSCRMPACPHRHRTVPPRRRTGDGPSLRPDRSLLAGVGRRPPARSGQGIRAG